MSHLTILLSLLLLAPPLRSPRDAATPKRSDSPTSVSLVTNAVASHPVVATGAGKWRPPSKPPVPSASVAKLALVAQQPPHPTVQTFAADFDPIARTDLMAVMQVTTNLLPTNTVWQTIATLPYLPSGGTLSVSWTNAPGIPAACARASAVGVNVGFVNGVWQ